MGYRIIANNGTFAPLSPIIGKTQGVLGGRTVEIESISETRVTPWKPHSHGKTSAREATTPTLSDRISRPQSPAEIAAQKRRHDAEEEAEKRFYDECRREEARIKKETKWVCILFLGVLPVTALLGTGMYILVTDRSRSKLT
jgi:hypothetical protein